MSCEARRVFASLLIITSQQMKIKRSKLRGMISEGMICSASELGMTSTSDGILLLCRDVIVGKPVQSLDVEKAMRS